MARQKRHTAESIFVKLREAGVELYRGVRVGALCRKREISEHTYSRWRKEYGGPKADQAKRLAVEHVCEELGVSERRACRVVRQHRSTHRRPRRTPDDERPLTARVVALAGAYGRYGYRRVTALLRREGWRVNHKQVERI